MNDLRQVNRFVQTRHNNIPFKESMSLSDIKGKSLTSRDRSKEPRKYGFDEIVIDLILDL